MSDIFDALVQTFHGESPYAGFDAAAYESRVLGWAFDNPVFEMLVTEVKPRLIIEVGTWLGASAIHMANIAKAHGIDTTILCVDTWLGSSIHRIMPEFRADLGLKHGFPTMYYQFLANVVHAGHDKTIIPMPLSSDTAFDWLKRFDVSADLVYIDGDHEGQTVYADMCNYWSRLNPKGVMFGDDFVEAWPGVVNAVNLFSQKNHIVPQIVREKWVFGFWKEFPPVVDVADADAGYAQLPRIS